MNANHQHKAESVTELLDSIRRLQGQDPEALGQLMDAICRDEPISFQSSAMCKEAAALTKALGHDVWELVEAVAFVGLARTLAFLRRETERHSAQTAPGRVI